MYFKYEMMKKLKNIIVPYYVLISNEEDYACVAFYFRFFRVNNAYVVFHRKDIHMSRLCKWYIRKQAGQLHTK